MAPVFQKSLKFNHFYINYGRICFPKLDNAISLRKNTKKKISTVSWHQTFFAMKMINHHDKQLTPSESWDQDGFSEPGFGVSSHSNHRARIFTTLWPPNQGEHLDRLLLHMAKIGIFLGSAATIFTRQEIQCLPYSGFFVTSVPLLNSSLNDFLLQTFASYVTNFTFNCTFVYLVDSVFQIDQYCSFNLFQLSIFIS